MHRVESGAVFGTGGPPSKRLSYVNKNGDTAMQAAMRATVQALMAEVNMCKSEDSPQWDDWRSRVQPQAKASHSQPTCCEQARLQIDFAFRLAVEQRRK